MFRSRRWPFVAATLCSALLVVAPTRAAEPPAPDPLAALEAHQQALFARVAPSVVAIITPDGMGSGFVVSKGGLIVTNQHVVGRHDTVELVFYNGIRVKGKVIERAGEVDLALVDAPIRHANPLEFARVDQLKVGAWAAAVGHGRGTIWTFNTGMISNIWSTGKRRPIIQTQIPLNVGNSGGPVIDRTGKVLGVVTAGDMEAQSLNFAIKADHVVELLQKVRPHCNCIEISAPEGVPIFVNDEMVGMGPSVAFIAEPREYRIFAVIEGKRREQKIRFPDARRVDFRTP